MEDKVSIKSLEISLLIEEVCQEVQDKVESLKPEFDGLVTALENSLFRLKKLADDLMIISREGFNLPEITKENEPLANVLMGESADDKSHQNSESGGSQQHKSTAQTYGDKVQTAFFEFKRLLMVKIPGMENDVALSGHLLQLWLKECNLLSVLHQVIDPTDTAPSATFLERYAKYQNLKSMFLRKNKAEADFYQEIQSWKYGLKSDSNVAGHEQGHGLKSDSNVVGDEQGQLLIQEDRKLLNEEMSHNPPSFLLPLICCLEFNNSQYVPARVAHLTI